MIGLEFVSILRRPTLRALLIREVNESDSAYFDSGANIAHIPGATLARLTGIETLASACVAHRIRPKDVPSDVSTWIDGIEETMLAWGAAQSRFYLQTPSLRIETALELRGYVRREEYAVIKKPSTRSSSPTAVQFRSVNTSALWQIKRSIHDAMHTGPDGHPAPADKWIEMERRRVEAGYMRPYLIEHDGEPIGAVSAARSRYLLRMKNLYIAPDYRRKKLGTATILQFANMATELGCVAAGAFVLADDPVVQMYIDARYKIVGYQTEYKKVIDQRDHKRSPGSPLL